MTILTASQSAIARLVGRRPAAVVSSTDEICVEITALAQEAATDIMKGHDWQALTRRHTTTAGDGEGYPLPADYDRMVLAMGLSSPSWPDWWFQPVSSLDEWELLKIRGFNLSPGWWMILGGRLHTLPALNLGEQANFYYISNRIFMSANGNPRATVTQDDDRFALDERLLTLALIWRWKQMKQMDYAEDMRSYEIALSQSQARDKGSQAIRHNGRVKFPGAVPAWPWELGHV